MTDEYKTFFEYFIDQSIADAGVPEAAIEILADQQLNGCWDVRTWYHEPHMLALNAKGKGGGSWDKFNKDGRAEAAGLTSGGYWDQQMNGNIQWFYEDWNEEAKNKIGYGLYVGGRSGGWWGFKIDDIERDLADVFEANGDAIAEWYQEHGAPLFDEADETSDSDLEDLAYELASSLSDEDYAKYFKFRSQFVDFCNEFENAMNETSDYWESDEYNDQAWEDQQDFLDESKKPEGNKLKEDYSERMYKFKKEVNDLCDWAIEELDGDRDALFFQGYGTKVLIKGKLLDIEYSRRADNMEEAFAELVKDYNSDTGANFDYKYLSDGFHQIEIMSAEDTLDKYISGEIKA